MMHKPFANSESLVRGLKRTYALESLGQLLPVDLIDRNCTTLGLKSCTCEALFLGRVRDERMPSLRHRYLQQLGSDHL